MEDGLWGIDTVPTCSAFSTGSAYLPPCTTGEVGGERVASPGVIKVPEGYDAVPAILTGMPLSCVGAGTGVSTGRGSTTGIGTVVNHDNTRYEYMLVYVMVCELRKGIVQCSAVQ